MLVSYEIRRSVLHYCGFIYMYLVANMFPVLFRVEPVLWSPETLHMAQGPTAVSGRIDRTRYPGGARHRTLQENHNS